MDVLAAVALRLNFICNIEGHHRLASSCESHQPLTRRIQKLTSRAGCCDCLTATLNQKSAGYTGRTADDITSKILTLSPPSLTKDRNTSSYSASVEQGLSDRTENDVSTGILVNSPPSVTRDDNSVMSPSLEPYVDKDEVFGQTLDDASAVGRLTPPSPTEQRTSLELNEPRSPHITDELRTPPIQDKPHIPSISEELQISSLPDKPHTPPTSDEPRTPSIPDNLRTPPIPNESHTQPILDEYQNPFYYLYNQPLQTDVMAANNHYPSSNAQMVPITESPSSAELPTITFDSAAHTPSDNQTNSTANTNVTGTNQKLETSVGADTDTLNQSSVTLPSQSTVRTSQPNNVSKSEATSFLSGTEPASHNVTAPPDSEYTFPEDKAGRQHVVD